MKPIVLTEYQWHNLKEQLKKDHPPSVLLIRQKMKEVLGFTDRLHTDWLGWYDDANPEDQKAGRHGYNVVVHLDFFDESKRLFFLLKYGDYISKSNISN